jgi:hypothetical protein
MAGNTVSIVVKAKDDASKTLGDVEKKASGLGKAFGDVAKIAGGFVLAQGILKAPSAIGSFVTSASTMNETLSKSNTIFGTNAKAIEDWASGAARDFGQSKQQALDAAASFGNLFVQLGIGPQAAGDMSTAMTELASDFASFHNADITEVIGAQTAAFRGEYDALQRFVPTINAAAVEQKALAMTGKTLTKELTLQEKAIAVQTLMLEGAGDAMGDFDKTSGGLANRQRMLSASFEDVKAKIGAGLLPVMTALAGVALEHVIPAISKVAEVINNLTNYFRFVVEDGDHLNDFLANLPEPMQGITHAVGKLVDAFMKQGIPAINEFVGLIRDDVLPPLQNLAEWFASNESAMQAAGVAIGTVLVAAFTAWAVAAGAAAIATIAAAAPVIAITLAVAALGAGIFLLAKHWDELSAKYPALEQAQQTLVAAFQSAVAYFDSDLMPAIRNIATAIEETSRLIVEKVQQYCPQIEAIITPIVDQVIRSVEHFAEVVSLSLGIIIDLLGGDFSGAWSKTKDLLREVTDFWYDTINNAKDLILGLLGGFTAVGKNLIDGLAKGASGAFDQLRLWLIDLPNKIQGAIGDLSSLLLDAGRQIVAGLKQGIENAWGAFSGWFTGKIDGLAGAAKDALKVWSPSRVFMEIGEHTMEGLGIGLQKGWKSFVSPTMNMITDELGRVMATGYAGGYSPGSGEGGQSGRMLNNGTWLANVGGGHGQEMPAQLRAQTIDHAAIWDRRAPVETTVILQVDGETLARVVHLADDKRLI